MTKSLTLAAATAISAVGLLSVPVPAQAYPIVPLAPACAKYEFYQGRLDMWQDNGILATVQGYGTNVGNTAQYNIPNQTAPTYGTPSGGIIGAGNVIAINVNWTQGPGAGSSSTYTGQIDDNGVATGTTTGQSGPAKWSTRGNTFKCIPPAAPAPAPPPEQPQPAPPEQPATPTATVTGDVDVYDVPGGGGNVTGILRAGSQVQFAGCKPDNWCHVTGNGVPNGDGWVWGDFLTKP